MTAIVTPTVESRPKLTIIMRTPREQRQYVRRVRTAVLAGVLLVVLAVVLAAVAGWSAGRSAVHQQNSTSVPLCTSLAGAPFPAAARAYGCVEIGPNGVLIGHMVNTYRCRDGSPLTLMVNDDDGALTEYAHGGEPVRIGSGFAARVAAESCGANS